MNNVKVLEGSEAVALAVKACRPHVISSYPISPQTHIVEALAMRSPAAPTRSPGIITHPPASTAPGQRGGEACSGINSFIKINK